MGAEFLSGLSQGLDKITVNSLQEAKQAVAQRESLEAANLANEFRAQMEEELIESENNYDYSGNYSEQKLQRFEEKQNEFLGGIQSDRVKRQLEEHLTRYKGSYNAHNLKFEIESERNHQKNLARQNQGARVGRFQANPVDDVYQAELLNIQNEFAGFDPSTREAYIQAETNAFNSSVVNTLANKIQTQFAEGKIATPEEYKRLMQTQVISKINDPKFFLTAESRNSLFLSYEAQTRKVSESLTKANTAALLGQSSSYLDLLANGQIEKDSLFEEQGLKAGTFTEEDLEVARLSGGISRAIVNGNLDLAYDNASELEQQYQSAIGRDDFKSAEGIKKQLDAVNGAIARKQIAMVKNLPDAMASNMSLQDALDGGNIEAYANELWRLGSGMIPETDFKLLKSGQVQQYANILNNASPEQIQGAIQTLKQEYNFHITGTPNNKRAFDYVKSQIAGTKGLSLKARGMFLYGDNPIYGARFINALKAEHGMAVTTADEFKKSELNASISKALQGYRKALATTSDVIFDQDNVIIFHEQLIAETAKGLVQNGDATPKDAVKMATEMTIGSRYDIVNSTGGSSHLLDKTFEGSQKYRDFIENTGAQKRFLRSTIPSFEDMLPEPGEMIKGLYGTEVGLPLNVIQNTGIFVPVESGSKLRLYVTYDLGGPGEGVRPLLLKDGSTYDIDPNDIELGTMDRFLKPTIGDQDIRGGGRF